MTLFFVEFNKSTYLLNPIFQNVCMFDPPNTPFTGAGQMWVWSIQRVNYGADVVGGVKN